MKGLPVEMEAVLAPIKGDNPAGEDLRYTPVYEQIREARKEDDLLSQGDWQREVKRADWNTVIQVAAEALAEKSKDLQIAVWLSEALIKKHGFSGLAAGLEIITAFLDQYWENLYPIAEDGDLEYRIGPLEFLNDKIAPMIREIPVTEERSGALFSWYQWQESRQVGYEKDTHNQWGDVDEGKQRAREDKIAEGKPTSEDFDAAAAQTAKAFCQAQAEALDACLETFTRLDTLADEKFGREAPRLSDIKQAIEDAQRLVGLMLKDKGGRDAESAALPVESAPETDYRAQVKAPKQEELMEPMAAAPAGALQAATPVRDSGNGIEEALWQDAQAALQSSGIKAALTKLLNAALSAPSPRQENRYRLMMVKLAIQAERPDLARSIVEELYALIQEYHLDHWESPTWIAEVIEAYYQCLTAEGATDEDTNKAYYELYPKLCSKDITKALLYKKGGF
ncbi:MAG: type VI secretion system protein TssA [Syntrophaceae bacterium]